MNGEQKTLNTAGASAIVALLLFSSATIARAQVTNLAPGQSINLATVINSNLTLQIADKQFGNFWFNYSDNIGYAQGILYSSNVTITALSNIIGFGISLTEPYSLLGVGTRDFVLHYTALVTAPNYYIDDIDLAVTGTDGNFGEGSLAENVFIGGFGATSVGKIQAFTSTNWGPISAQANIVPPQTELWVEKDVILQGSQNYSSASISEIDQTYSEIPEPSTVFLVGVGVLGAVAVIRRRKS